MKDDPMAFFPKAQFIEAAMNALIYDKDGKVDQNNPSQLEDFTLHALCLARFMQICIYVDHRPQLPAVPLPANEAIPPWVAKQKT